MRPGIESLLPRRRRFLAAAFLCFLLSAAGQAQTRTPSLDDLLARTSKYVAGFLDQFSSVKCTEHVLQEKFGENGKVERKADATFDYLVILTNAGGELSLDESRLAVKEAKAERNPVKKNISLLVSNGFATLFLVFHPYYQAGFDFTDQGEDLVEGRPLKKIHFQHVRGMRTPTALLLRDKEYPLELAGTAWVEPETGVIVRMSAGIGAGMEDVGLRALRSEVEYAPAFQDTAKLWWFPRLATIEVETPRQHWRNTHHFTDYKRFSVSTEETVASQP
jgi:hypothetical protein